jgi:putative transposase
VQSIKLKNNNNSIRFENNKLKLPIFGFVKYKDNRIIQGNILSATVKYENSRWFAVLNCKNVPIEPLPKTNDSVGIDLGLTNLMTFSNGEKRKPITHLNRIEKLIARLNKNLARKVKGSKNFKKNVDKLHKLYNKAFDIRNDEYQKLSTEIIQNFDLIGLKKLQRKNVMCNRGSVHNIGQIAWTRLINMIKYKSEWYEKTVIQLGLFFPSSKLCNNCRYEKEDLALKVREWICPECKTHHDRNVNASINILNEALRINKGCTAGTAGI